MFRKLCEHYGYTPKQIGELTLQQVRILCSDEKELGGVVKMSRMDAKRLGLM